MASPRWIFAFSLVVLACEPQQPTGWTRVAYDDSEDHRRYFIAQADPEANTCVRIELRAGDITWNDEVYVELDGLDGFEVSSAWVERGNPEYPDYQVARDCSTIAPLTDFAPPRPVVRGKLEFSEFVSDADRTRPCRVSFELDVTDHDYDEPEVVYSIVARDVAIVDVGCPHPNNVVTNYTELDAALGEVDGIPTVVISSWDAANEVCVWARLLASPDAVASPSEVVAPGPWVYGGLRVAEVERAACIASELLDPKRITAALNTSVGPMSSTGTVVFSKGPVEAPCELDVDLELKSGGVFYWDPNIVRMQAEQVVVAGC